MKKFLLFFIIFISCSSSPIQEKRTYRLQKITGEWIAITYTLTQEDKVSLTTSYGDPVLSCICNGKYKILRPAIIDMELIRVDKINENNISKN